MDTTVTDAVEYLKKEYRAKIILLYGSYSLNAQNRESDIDLFVFADIEESKHESKVFDGHMLDAWVYPVKEIENPKEYIHIYPCIIQYDELSKAEKFVKEIVRIREEKTIKMALGEKQQIDRWIEKMIQRGTQDSPESNYRYVWLIYDFPELYCKYHGIYYDGPIKTICHMKEHDSEVYIEYEWLLQNGKDIRRIEELYKRVEKSYI
jgi:hypothetical protein